MGQTLFYRLILGHFIFYSGRSALYPPVPFHKVYSLPGSILERIIAIKCVSNMHLAGCWVYNSVLFFSLGRGRHQTG